MCKLKFNDIQMYTTVLPILSISTILSDVYRFLGAQLQAEEKQKELKEVTEKLELVKLESSQHTERQEQHRSQVADLEAQLVQSHLLL